MAEWLIERGIGEDRALLVEGGEAIAAKLRWPDEPHAGQGLALRLVAKPAGSRRGLARDAAGREYLLDRLPATITEGVDLEAHVVRAALAERGRHKRPLARVGASAVEDVFVSGREVHGFPSGLWEDVWASAAEGEIAFSGGALLLCATPAMTLVDIDGALPPRELALAAVPALGRALRLFDIGGSIGVDFPTLADKADRRAVDAALAAALAAWPHERTAMNGFGFVQIVTRLEGPSLLHLLAFRRKEAAVRMALRQAERVEGAGITLLTVNPALEPLILPEWHAALERRTGRALRVACDPTLAVTAAAAQIVAA